MEAQQDFNECYCHHLQSSDLFNICLLVLIYTWSHKETLKCSVPVLGTKFDLYQAVFVTKVISGTTPGRWILIVKLKYQHWTYCENNRPHKYQWLPMRTKQSIANTKVCFALCYIFALIFRVALLSDSVMEDVCTCPGALMSLRRH